MSMLDFHEYKMGGKISEAISTFLNHVDLVKVTECKKQRRNVKNLNKIKKKKKQIIMNTITPVTT